MSRRAWVLEAVVVVCVLVLVSASFRAGSEHALDLVALDTFCSGAGMSPALAADVAQRAECGE